MSIQGGPDIVENGLILCYDPANIDSYVSGSTTMYDLSTTGNTASLVGGVAYTGSFNGIFNFDGINDYINIARPSGIATSGSFSVCMFAKWKTVGTTTSSIQTLLDNNHNSSPVQGFVIQDRPDLSRNLSFSVRPDQVGAISSFYVGNDNWYHITGTHDGTVTRLYINGALDAFASQSGGIATVQPSINIGRWQNADTGLRYFTGSIGQVLVYNRTLSLAEVQQNYNTIKFRYPSPPAYPPDLYFGYVTLLLHGDGTNADQNNTFLDSGPSNNSITRSGNTTQGSFSPYGDRWSVLVSGSSAHLRSANNANLNIGSSDFTFECWANGSSFSTDWATFFGRWNSSGNYGYFFNYDTDGGLTFIYSTTGLAAGNVVRVYGGTMTVGKWHHVAFCRSGGTTRAFLDGVQIGSATSDNVTIFNSNGQQVIGGVLDASTIYHPFTGYISNLRLVIGTALYTSNFTPSSSPLTAIANTRILACASNRFIDKSPTGLTLNPNGTPSVQRFSPFSPDTLYRTDRIGGSAYFDGSGDWLSVANRALKLESELFTAECWVYLSTSPASDFSGYTIFGDYYWTGGNTGGYFVTIGNGKVNLFASAGIFNTQASNILVSNNSITYGQWNHIAIVRGSGNLINIYINGVSTTTPVARTSLSLSSGGAANHQSRIGTRLHDSVNEYGSFAGIISDLRVINGGCLYTANFTPPTEPLASMPETEIPGITFLGRFTNGAIVDYSMTNNLGAIGNAQISTSVKKYGTGAIFFDGSGDYLTVVNNPGFRFGTGDFTIECWIYIAGNSAADGGGNRTAGLFSAYATSGVVSNGYTFEIEGNASTTGTGISFYNNVGGSQTSVIASTTVSQTTWHHVAVSRSGTITRLFLNGTLVGSGTLGNQNVNSDYTINIGRLGYTSYLQEFNGYIDDLRVTNGIARYTSNFTPPNTQLPDL